MSSGHFQRGNNYEYFEHFQARYEAAKDEELSIQDFLALCKENKSAYANAAEHLLLAIGEPEMIDTSKHSRLSRIFSNRVIARYKTFEDFMAWKKP